MRSRPFCASGCHRPCLHHPGSRRTRRHCTVARGLFQTGRTDFYDIACLDTGAACYSGKSSAEVLEACDERKIGKYGDRCAPYGSFTPLICSIYGTLAPEASKLAHKVAQRVDPEREERDAVMELHHTMIQAES